jgi:hypothetical protein
VILGADAGAGGSEFALASRAFRGPHPGPERPDRSGQQRSAPGQDQSNSPRNPACLADRAALLGSLDRLHRLPPVLRRAVWALPEQLQPQPVRTLWVLAVDATGSVVHDLQGPGDRYTFVTGVREHGGRLYLGSLTQHAVAVLDLSG